MCETPTCEGAKQLAEMLAEVTTVLRRLSNEVSACVTVAERELRDALGNTNVAVLRTRLEDARELLAKLEA